MRGRIGGMVDLSPLMAALIVIAIIVGAGGELIWSYAERRNWRFSLRTLLIATTLLAVALGLAVAGCGGTIKPIRPGEAMALNAAQTWLDSQGIDRGSVTLSADQSGDEWSVLIEREPATPGGHNLLRIKADGSITEVIPGA